MKIHHYDRTLDPPIRDKRAAKTISAIIAALLDEGHRVPLEVGDTIEKKLLSTINKILIDKLFTRLSIDGVACQQVVDSQVGKLGKVRGL